MQCHMDRGPPRANTHSYFPFPARGLHLCSKKQRRCGYDELISRCCDRCSDPNAIVPPPYQGSSAARYHVSVPVQPSRQSGGRLQSHARDVLGHLGAGQAPPPHAVRVRLSLASSDELDVNFSPNGGGADQREVCEAQQLGLVPPSTPPAIPPAF